MAIQRAVAYKLGLKDVINADYHAGKSIDNPNYIETNGLKATRVNVIGKVVEKFDNEKGYNSITIENKDLRIKIKAFEKKINVNENDLVKVIGKVRESENERFILGEIVRKVSENEIKLHELESKKTFENVVDEKINEIEEDENNESFVENAGSV